MAVGSPLGKLFGASPIRPLQHHMQLANQAVGQLAALLRAGLDDDGERRRALGLELEASARAARELQTDLQRHLPRGLFLAMPRPDLLHLLEAQQTLVDSCRRLARSVLFRPPGVPGPARKSLDSLLGRCEALSRLVLDAIESTDELLETGFGGAEARQVEKQLDALSRRVRQAEKQADKLRSVLLRGEGDVPALDSAFNYRLVDGLDELAHACDEIGGRLRLLLAS